MPHIVIDVYGQHFGTRDRRKRRQSAGCAVRFAGKAFLVGAHGAFYNLHCNQGVFGMHDQKLVADYLRKCFVSVDGLWFMKVEEDSDFEKALEFDIEVWKVLPKIEARTIQGLINPGEGIEGLQRALEFKLSAELFLFELSPSAMAVLVWICVIAPGCFT